jgi:hypothetical protein
MELTFICRPADEQDRQVCIVRELAEELRNAWASDQVLAAIESAHVHGAQSEAISLVIADDLRARGFTSEQKGLFAGYPVPGLRPDWYRRLEGDDGVIVEVERGGVLTNNRDLLDFYKCHICREASHLFLLAPVHVHGRGWLAVENRMRALFEDGVDSNVRSVAVFGYGN